jgi:hypothetical protein
VAEFHRLPEHPGVSYVLSITCIEQVNYVAVMIPILYQENGTKTRGRQKRVSHLEVQNADGLKTVPRRICREGENPSEVGRGEVSL